MSECSPGDLDQAVGLVLPWFLRVSGLWSLTLEALALVHYVPKTLPRPPDCGVTSSLGVRQSAAVVKVTDKHRND